MARNVREDTMGKGKIKTKDKRLEEEQNVRLDKATLVYHALVQALCLLP